MDIKYIIVKESVSANRHHIINALITAKDITSTPDWLTRFSEYLGSQDDWQSGINNVARHFAPVIIVPILNVVLGDKYDVVHSNMIENASYQRDGGLPSHMKIITRSSGEEALSIYFPIQGEVRRDSHMVTELRATDCGIPAICMQLDQVEHDYVLSFRQTIKDWIANKPHKANILKYIEGETKRAIDKSGPTRSMIRKMLHIIGEFDVIDVSSSLIKYQNIKILKLRKIYARTTISN